jgi:multidrug efflux pump subunit AcrA (membrane-fusion protein)
MLSQIEAQDSALQTAQHTLEDQVHALQREIVERQRAENQLADAHTQLVETSRQAGMAEVATGVLHNVGNVLNSVNVSATLVSERVRQSKAENLLKASMLLREHAGHLEEFFAHDPRAKLLLDYLPNLGDAPERRTRRDVNGARVADEEPRPHQGHRRDAAELREGLRLNRAGLDREPRR